MSENPMTDITPAQPEPAKKRGAPVGNHNAFRHGFYARDLGAEDHPPYNEADMRNLLGEAAMLKDYMYKLYQSNIDSTDSVVISDTLRALSLAGLSLARVLQVHSNIRIRTRNSPSTLNELLSDLDAATQESKKFY